MLSRAANETRCIQINKWTGVRRQGSLVQGWRWLWQHVKTGAAQLQDAVLAVLQIPNMREVRRRAEAQHTPYRTDCMSRTASGGS